VASAEALGPKWTPSHNSLTKSLLPSGGVASGRNPSLQSPLSNPGSSRDGAQTQEKWHKEASQN